MDHVRVDLLTREYPPHVYGGAGVHVAGLTRVLERTIDVRVHCFDGPRDAPGVLGYTVPTELAGANAALQTFGIDLEMADAVGAVGADAGMLSSRCEVERGEPPRHRLDRAELEI